MSGGQTGVFFMGASPSDGKTPAAFPKQYRRRPLGDLDRRFLGILGVCGVVFFVSIWILSHRDVPETISDKEIAKIQERYARLILNQPKPKQEERKIEQTGPAADGGAQKKEEAKVDRENESVAERTQRREASRGDRAAKREQISKTIQSSGLFAAITSSSKSGGGGGSSSVSDLLGAGGEVGDLGSIQIDKGTFATRDVNAGELKARKGGERGSGGSGVGIARESIGRAEGGQLASAGSVNLSSAPAEMSSESGSQVTSKSCIQRIINTESRRIKRVYEGWLKRDPTLSGQIQVKFTILPGGAVSTVTIIKSTTNNSEFDQTITRTHIARWSFADCSVGESVEVVFPFVFESSQP